MIYPVDFIKMAGTVNHVEFAKYLHDLGWKSIKTTKNTFHVFQHERDNDFFQADIPTTRALSDYDRTIYRAIEEVARFSQKSTEQVLLELINPLSDIIRIRLKNEDLESGSIYMEDAITLYENTRKLLTAAAMDVLNPAILHRGRPDSTIQKFISTCRFGQTEIGSYIVSVVCPISKIEDNDIIQLSLFQDEQEAAHSLTRNTINKMLSSAQAIKEGIDGGNYSDSLLQENKISVNFLDALNMMGINKDKMQVDVSIQWAPTIRENRSNISTITLTHDYSAPIETIVRKVKKPINEEKSYVGRISHLNSTTDVKNRTTGIITLVFVNEANKASSASVELPLTEYNQAIDAHRNGKYVRIKGTLSGTGKKRIECSEFSVEE